MISSETYKPMPEWLFTDPITLALLKFISKGPNRTKNCEQYASAFVTDTGKILSISRNMQVKRDEGWFILQGYANHAEMMAYSVARLLYPESVHGLLYVIGFLSNGSVFVHKNALHGKTTTPRFTCNLCAKQACEHQIKGILLPTAKKWQKLDSKTSLSTALEFNEIAGIIGKSSARIDEQIPLQENSVKEFILHLNRIKPHNILRTLENEFELSPFAVEIVRLLRDGYMQTGKYKNLVFQMASQSK